MTNLARESVDDSVRNRNLIIGTTAIEVNPKNFRFIKGALLRTPGAEDPEPNTVPIWIGSSLVTADSDTESGGFPLLPGSSIFIPSEFLSGLYAISSAANQKLAWLGL